MMLFVVSTMHSLSLCSIYRYYDSRCSVRLWMHFVVPVCSTYILPLHHSIHSILSHSIYHFDFFHSILLSTHSYSTGLPFHSTMICSYRLFQLDSIPFHYSPFVTVESFIDSFGGMSRFTPFISTLFYNYTFVPPTVFYSHFYNCSFLPFYIPFLHSFPIPYHTLICHSTFYFIRQIRFHCIRLTYISSVHLHSCLPTLS